MDASRSTILSSAMRIKFSPALDRSVGDGAEGVGVGGNTASL